MQIYVKFPNGKTIVVNTDKSNTIKSVKDIIYNETNVIPNKQKLIFHDTQINDEEKTLSDYQIFDNTTIFLFEIKPTKWVRETNPSWAKQVKFGDLLICDVDNSVIGVFDGTLFNPTTNGIPTNILDKLPNGFYDGISIK